MILAVGGFAANRAMMRTHAPAARGGLPLATPGDDGSGIRLGTEAGSATAFLDRVSVWRFLSPPPALLAGVLVDRAGQRVCDESRYGAAIGDAIIRHGGQAWLLIDHATRAQARRQVRGSTLWFQRLQAWYLLSLGVVRAPTMAAVAARAGVDPAGLAATVAAYNAASRDPAVPHPAMPDPDPAVPDPAGKPAAVCRPQDQPPYYLIDVSVRPACSTPPRSSPSAASSSRRSPARSCGPTASRWTACTPRAAPRPACAHAPTSAACPWPTASSPAAGPAAAPPPPQERRPLRHLRNYARSCDTTKSRPRAHSAWG